MAKPAATVSGLQPYPAYKPSGVEWLREVPAHWEVRRLKTLCSKSAIYGANVAATSYAAAGVRFIRTTDITEDGILRPAGVFLPREAVLDYLLTDGDLLISRSGTIGRSFLYRRAVHGPCAYAGYLVRFVLAFGISPEYTFLFTKTPAFGAFLQSMTISSTIENVNASKYANCPLPVPPLAEQAAITRYLDHADRCIRRCIQAKEQLVKLLEEQRQALVNEAVTGQIDVRTGRPYPAYKPSEVEGLREVPSHWDVRPAKWHFREVDERSTTGSEELLSVSHLTGVTPRSEKNVTMFQAESNVGYKICRSGDVVINTMWAWMAALGVARQLGIVSPSYAVYRHSCNSLLSGDYGELLLRSAPYQAEYRRLSTGIRPSRLRLYPDAFLRIGIVCPPPEEQSDIVAFVQRESANSERVFRLIREEIATLQEYRTLLIADVVTGKLDVREAAAELPDGIEQTIPSTELDTPSKIDPSPADSLGAVA